MQNGNKNINHALGEGYDLSREWLKSAKDFFNDQMRLPSMLMAIAHLQDFVLQICKEITPGELSSALDDCLQMIKEAKEGNKND